jgi:3-dehydroquinate dehydratase-2
MRIQVVNGPNLKLLGTREPAVYGRETLDSILKSVRERARQLGVGVDCFQSDVEGELVACIGACRDRADGLILNPAAYTHTSIAIRDAVSACGLPCVEVHLSNVYRREAFRHVSYTAPVCVGVVAGFGGFGYVLALEALVRELRGRQAAETPRPRRGRRKERG